MRNKFTVFFRAFLSLMLAMSMLIPCGIPAHAAEAAWTPSEHTQIFWVQTADSKKEDAALVQQIKLFDSELASKVTTNVLPIVCGTAEDAGENDILLQLDRTLDIAKEGYQISVDGKRVLIAASDRDGLFYGCRKLIQQLLISGSVSGRKDQPDVAERGVSLDNGRKYYSVDWLKTFIREMSWSNMNTLVLHFSEEMGLGIESKLYPWLAGRDGTLCTQSEVATDNTYLTQTEIAEIVKYARLYHVEIVPSFDSPGHMNYVVKKFNEKCADSSYTFTYGGKTYTAEVGTEIGNYFHYNGKTAIVQGSRNGNYSRGIDISNEIAVAFTKSLIEEYASVFHSLGCKKFDIGGDELLGWGSAVVSTSVASRWQQLDHWKEYAIHRTGNSNAVAYDAFLLYMNDLYDLVMGLGYTSVRMWNDDALRSKDTGWNGAVQLNTDIDIWYWSEGTNPVKTYLDAGYQVYNIINHYTYYVVSNKYYSGSSYPNARPESIYNQWNPYTFGQNPNGTGSGNDTKLHDPNVLGSAFAVWCDEPTVRTENQVMTDLIPLIRANAAKAWDAQCNATVSYKTHCANNEKMGNAPYNLPAAPDVTEVRKLDLTAYEKAIAAFDSTDSSLYTADSYAAYADAVRSAKNLVESDACTQEALDEAVANILKMEQALVAADPEPSEPEPSEPKPSEPEPSEPETSDPGLILQSASVKLLNKKYVMLTAYLLEDTQSIEVYDMQGNPVSLLGFSPAEGDEAVTVLFASSGSGIRTYQVFAIDKNQNRAKEPVFFSVIG